MNRQERAKQSIIQIVNTANWLQGQMTDMLSPYGISVQQLRTLAIVAKHQDNKATVNLIRQEMYDPMSNVSRLLNKLVDRGLIAKIRGTDDQRIVFVQLTEAGEQILSLGQAALDKGMTKLACLSDEQFGQINELLTKIRRS